MTVRKASDRHLTDISSLAQEFGHLMTYMQTPEGIKPHIKDMVVKEDDKDHMSTGRMIGFYHCRTLVDKADVQFVIEQKGIPEFLMDSAWHRSLKYMNNYYEAKDPLGILMQGGSHREVFHELISFLQETHSELWCWCSIKSSRPDGYKKLGFSFNPKIEYTFHNPHVNRESTYQLGRWVRSSVDGS